MIQFTRNYHVNADPVEIEERWKPGSSNPFQSFYNITGCEDYSSGSAAPGCDVPDVSCLNGCLADNWVTRYSIKQGTFASSEQTRVQLLIQLNKKTENATSGNACEQQLFYSIGKTN